MTTVAAGQVHARASGRPSGEDLLMRAGILALTALLVLFVAVPLATIASLAVLALSRDVLRAGDTFPELARFRLLRRFILR